MATARINFRPASRDDLQSVLNLLTASSLPTDGVEDHLTSFIVAERAGVVVGCGGLEVYRTAALLRSVVVAPDFRGRGIADEIVRLLLERTAGTGVHDIYLLTTTAEGYFGTRGFDRVDRASLNPELAASAELRGACPATAVAMRRLVRSAARDAGFDA